MASDASFTRDGAFGEVASRIAEADPACALVRRVLKRPALARVLNNWLRMVPSVHARIRGAVAADMGIDSVIQPVVEDRPRPGQVVDVTVVAERVAASKLSARGHKIYERMLAIRNGESA
ncbi:hypothetical protein XAP6164_3380015 [Xanthomonas phaseoli pv. phaseoli]|nr:hypothetical protein XAP6164_3380015 [Xanthomonas phaseoli pv. phaseoli]